MKNVLRKYTCLFIFIFINIVLTTYSKVIKRGNNNITSNYLFPNNYDNNSSIYKKRNSNQFYFLENEKNKLKELWNKLTTRYSIKFHTNNETENEETGKNNKISFKNVFNKISIQDNMEMINNVIIKNSTVINAEILNELMKQNKLLTIRYKDINTIINIINNYYASNNYLFSKVLTHEVVKKGKDKTLVIYVKECIVHKIMVKIHSCDKEKKQGDSNWNKIRKGFQENDNVETNLQMDHKDVKLFQHNDKSSQHNVKLFQHNEKLFQHNDKSSQHNDISSQHNEKLFQHNDKSSQHNEKLFQHNDKSSQHNEKLFQHNDKSSEQKEVSPNPNITNFNKDIKINDKESENISNEEPKENVLLNRESVLYKDVLNYNLKEKSVSNRKLRRFFENKMNIKENGIFVWNENIYNLLVDSNLFKYVQMKLYNDKTCNKNILEINIIENKRMILIPSLSKGFNDFLEFCLNLSFSYLHSLTYSDKFRMKYFQNLNYKNNKHNYDFIFINDLIELEKLKKNYPSFQIMGMNINKEYKKEVHTSSLNNLMNIISIKNDHNDDNDDETLNVSSPNLNQSNSLFPNTPKYFLQVKDLYNYLYKKTLFFFFIKRMNNVILEIKTKFKRKDFQNFFYFLKEQRYYSSDVGSTQVCANKSDDHNNVNNNNNNINNSNGNVSNISKWKNRLLYKCMNLFRNDKKSVLSNKLYNLYGSKIKLSTSINLCNPNLFQTSNFLKKYFNVKNKFDLIFYFNMQKNNFPYEKENSSNTIENNDNNEDNLNSKNENKNNNNNKNKNKNENLHKDFLYFFKHVNEKSSHLKWNNINNIYLNYTLHFNKNYEINMYDLFCTFQNMIKKKILKIKNYCKKGKDRNKGNETKVINELNLSNNDNANSVYIPLYFFKLSINDMSLLLNIMFSFKKNLWTLNNILFDVKDNENKNGKNILSHLKNILKCNIKNEQDNSKKFKEKIDNIKVTASNENFTNNTCTTYTLNNINMNDAYKEYFNKMNLSLNYKLIFPVIFNNYFLNLLHMKLYLFFNCNIFDKLQESHKYWNENNKTERNHKHIDTINILKGYYIKSKNKKKKKEHQDNSSYGLGILLFNMNIYLNFKLHGNNFLPSLVLKSKEDNSKFNYLL
ncbi:conserved Plasmodium protein, unknown function [Plasmodium reichenowi]|uniref:POTRA domain-containing protein n=1 Tax=Plasmodium reichenowi TaxID=5854 RepID=A0A060S1A2_PLARE|nr:conserved Plasmodium protein, unknown function [Plasmodium reichenowi]